MGFGKNSTGVILRSKETATIGTLAADTAILLGSSITTVDAFRMLKAEITASIRGLTAGDGAGMLFGLAEGSLTIAQIAAALLADGPVGRGDRDDEELAERWVRIIGQLVPSGSGQQGQFIGMNGSAVMEVKPRWTFSEDEGWNFFVFNMGAPPTTGGQLSAIITHYGLWL